MVKIMYAIIRTGGKQYKVEKDSVIRVEKLAEEAGKKIKIEDILMVNDGKKTVLGEPVVSGASVTAEIVSQERNDKIIVFKKKRRQNYRRKKGHRQDVTILKVTDIKAA